MRARVAVVFLFVCAMAVGGFAQAPSVPCRSGPFARNESGKNFVDRNFSADPAGSWRFTNFENADLRGAVFIGVDLTGSSFKNAKLGPSAKGTSSFNRATLEKTCFIDAKIDGADFTYARLKCADFANTSLMKAEFGFEQNIDSSQCRTTFIGSQMDVNAIAPENWKRVDFSYANFQNVDPATFNLRGVDLTGVMLPGVNLSGVDFSGANLTDADLGSGAKFIRAKFDNASLNGAKLNKKSDFTFASFKCARFYGKADPSDTTCSAQPLPTKETSGADLSEGVFGNADFTRAVLNSAVLRAATLAGATLRNTSLRDAYLEPGGSLRAASVVGADLTSANLTGAHVNYVQFNNVVLTRAIFSNSTLSGTNFNGAIMPAAEFVSSTLQNVSFNGAILQGANFSKSIIEKSPDNTGNGVTFTCAHLGGANFQDAKVRAADFQSAVMPPASACCTPDKGQPYCGKIDLLGLSYGPVVFPVLNADVICPNGQIGKCSEQDWQIPNWQTTLCGRGSETVWSKPDCGGTPGEIVNFKDAKLKACISRSLPNQPAEISLDTARKILNVSCPAQGIADISGLEQFTNATSLDLSGNHIEAYALRLPQLRTLKISGNGLKTLDLARSNFLLWLDASNNDLKAINGLTNISFTFVDVSHNQLTAFELPVQDTLVYADLSYNQLANVQGSRTSPLDRLKQLKYLNLSHNLLKTIGSIAPLATQNLSDLFLSCNADFACNTLGIDGESKAMQRSSCAVFNPQTSKWSVVAHPECNSRMRRKAK